MKLLDDIVDLLSDGKGSLTEALLKTKVLMHKIGYKELAEWVNDELNGYPPDKPVPPYRVIHSRLVGHLQNIAYAHSNVMLPTQHLPEKTRRMFHENNMRESISVLERFANNDKGHLTVPVGPEYHQQIDKVLDGFWVQRMWIQMEPTQVLHSVTEVRSRLLDFVLSLQDKLGDLKDDEVKEAAKDIDAAAMFRGAVFGDNATVVIGDKNTTHITNTIRRDDFESLATALRRAGVEQGDIALLQDAVQHDTDSVDHEKKQFGGAVKAWMSRMLGKAVEASWNIELGVAGGLLTEALKAYYF
ncbi:MAG: hypothetical protein ABI605_13185 [Rhizobacter sp.]